jgi:hypothetical protein
LVKKTCNDSQLGSTRNYGFEVGEHVFVDGHDGEFVVIEIDRASHMLQLLPVGRVGRIENFSAASVRIVMPPKSKARSKEEIGVDSFGNPTAA